MKGKTKTGEGKEIGKGEEPTRSVDSVGMRCSERGSFVQVNGQVYPFDIAWVISGEGSGPSIDGPTSGAGWFAIIEAISFSEQQMVFAKVYAPTDSHDDTDDTVIVTSLAGYMPPHAHDAIVRRISQSDQPQLETFIPTDGGRDGIAKEGISLRVPREDALGRARYASVARFYVAKD
jgi:hypothetical protein